MKFCQKELSWKRWFFFQNWQVLTGIFSLMNPVFYCEHATMYENLFKKWEIKKKKTGQIQHCQASIVPRILFALSLCSLFLPCPSSSRSPFLASPPSLLWAHGSNSTTLAPPDHSTPATPASRLSLKHSWHASELDDLLVVPSAWVTLVRWLTPSQR